MAKECLFCEMAKDPSKVAQRIAESQHALAFLDIRPIRKGHALVIPKKHATGLSDVGPEEMGHIMALVLEVASTLRQRLGTSGENLLVASGPGSEQSVFHLHVHVIPRVSYDDLRWNDWWQTKVHAPRDVELEDLARFIRGESTGSRIA